MTDALGNFSRPHIQGDMTASDAIVNGGVADARGNQNTAHSFYENAAAGNGPNVAQANMNLGLDRLMTQQAAQSTPGLSSLAAQRSGGAAGSGLVSQGALQRQQEQASSLQGMGQSTQALQGAEMGLLNTGMNRAQGQMSLDLQSQAQNTQMANANMTLADKYNQLEQQNKLNAYLKSLGLQNAYDDIALRGTQLTNYNIGQTVSTGADTISSIAGKK